MTWSDLDDLVGRVATRLSALLAGAEPPCRAVFLSENRWELPVLQAAAATIGLPLVGIDYSLPVEHVAACLEQVRPTLLVTSDSRADLALRALDLLPATCAPVRVRVLLGAADGDAGHDGWLGWSDLLATAPDPESLLAFPFEGLGFTSGTSGAPKLVLRRKSFEARRQRDVVDFFGFTEADVYLNTVPLYHASGPGWARIFWNLGAPVVLADHNDPSSMLAALENEQVTATLAVPPVLSALLDHLDGLSRTPSLALRAVVTGGRHISPRLVRQTTEHLGDVLHIYYGTTETGLNTLTRTGELTSDPTSVGKPFPGNSIAILDEQNRPLPPEHFGRVAIAGYMVADEYVGRPSPKVRVAGQDWWLTADTGRLSGDGRLFIASRDVPAQAGVVDVVGLEGRLKDIFDVGDLAILVDHNGGGRTCLTVAYSKGVASTPAPALVATAAGELCPGSSVLAVNVPHLPYSPTGKIKLSTLRTIISDATSSSKGIQ